jgi:GNAT superfamily N-acetyltransferase
MDRAELLALMDLNMFEMYREIARATAGGFVVERAGLVMCGSPLGTVITNMAMVADLVGVDVVRAETERVFHSDGLPFSVWTRAHADGPLETALVRAGFLDITSTPGMAFVPGPDAPVAPAADVDIRPVGDDAGRAAYADIMADAYAVYGAPKESTRSHFARLASVTGPTTQGFLAYHGGRPVAGAILYLTHGIGGVGWVGTHPDSFGHGFGTAVTWTVVREGLARGARFLNLQASPMGAPVYRRMGFTTPTHYRVFVAPD